MQIGRWDLEGFSQVTCCDAFPLWDKLKAETLWRSTWKEFEGQVTERKRLQLRIPYPFKLFTSCGERKIFAGGKKVREHVYLNTLSKKNACEMNQIFLRAKILIKDKLLLKVWQI